MNEKEKTTCEASTISQQSTNGSQIVINGSGNHITIITINGVTSQAVEHLANLLKVEVDKNNRLLALVEKLTK